MHCERCRSAIKPGEEREHHGRLLCEDCYMDTLSPARACDPWAVHSAKSLVQEQGRRIQVTEAQQKILEVLKETGGIQAHELAERLQMKPTDLEREIASLRHMEKLRAEMRGDKKLLVLW